MPSKIVVGYSLADWLTYGSFLFSIAAGVYSTRTWFKFKKQKQTEEELITVVIQCEFVEDKHIELPARIRRKNLTRAEVQGLIRLLPLKKGMPSYYELSYLRNREFFTKFEQLQDIGKELIIKCDESEFSQFDLQKIRVQYGGE